MVTYSNLVSGIAGIHGTPPGVTPAFALPGQWIPSVVDNTSANESAELPVLVAFGANYGTGWGHLPTSATARARKVWPWVEYDLKRWKSRGLRHITNCATGRVKTHWNGFLPFDIDQSTLPSQALKLLGQRFHFVMNNACPFITDPDWSKIRDTRLEDIFDLFHQSSLRPSYWQYFESLHKVAGKRAVWIGHGNAEIYGLFRLLCRRIGVDLWFFDSNLSFPSQFEKPGANGSTKGIEQTDSSAGTPGTEAPISGDPVSVIDSVDTVLDDEIFRLINNQRREHVKDPFHGGGRKDFAVLKGLLDRVSPGNLAGYLDAIEDMRTTHNGCFLCDARILAFCEIFTEHKLPKRHALYKAEYDDLINNSRASDTDFREEARRFLDEVQQENE